MTGRRWACFIALEQNFVQGRTILTSVVLMPSGEKGRISPTVNLECDVRKASLVRVFAIGPFCSHCFVAKRPLAHTTPRRRTGRGCQCQRRAELHGGWAQAPCLPRGGTSRMRPSRCGAMHGLEKGEPRNAMYSFAGVFGCGTWRVGGPVRTHLSPCCHF